MSLGLALGNDSEAPTSPVSSGALEPGQSVGPYEIRGRLGVGGMGEVYRGFDRRLHRDVALKVLPPEFAADPERVGRFRREARLLASMNHPHIAGIYDLVDLGDALCLILELVEGSTLSTALREAPPDPDRALGIASQIADGLQTAHTRGVVHRDLKPGNVMVRPDGQVKILDFGIAREVAAGGAVDDLTVTGTLIGTIPYMSPEQIRGRPVDARTDVWSFGCVLFELLSGRHPFLAETRADTLGAILERPAPMELLPRTLSDDLRELVERCLRKDPRRRLSDMGDIHRRLEEVRARAGASGGPVWWGSRQLISAVGLLASLSVLTAAQSGLLEQAGRRLVARIQPLLADGGAVVAGMALLALATMLVSKVVGRLRRQLSSMPQIAAVFIAPLVYAASITTVVVAHRRFTAIVLLAWLVSIAILARSPRRSLLARWPAAVAPVVVMLALFVAEGWWIAHAAETRDELVDVYVVLPFERLNDEESEELLDVTEHYRATLEATFGELASVHVLPKSFSADALERYPPQCSYRRLLNWLQDSELAPDVVLCSKVDLFESEGEPGVTLVSTLRRVQNGALINTGGPFKQTASYADIEWLSLHESFRILRALRQLSGLELSDEDEEQIRRRILDRYETFLQFRVEHGASASALVESAVTQEMIADDDVRSALESYQSPIDLEEYVARHQAARRALATRTTRN